MLSLTKYAIQLAEGQTFGEPTELLARIKERVHDYGRQLSSRRDLRETFALNALVPVEGIRRLGIAMFQPVHGREGLPAVRDTFIYGDEDQVEEL